MSDCNHPFYNQSDQNYWTHFKSINDSFDIPVDLELPLVQNLDPLLERGSTAMSLPDNVPTSVDLYFQRFRNISCDLKEDLFALIREVWHEESPLTIDEKLEVILKISTWDDWGFDVDSFDLPHFVACQYAIMQTSHQPNANKFLIENVQSMNYAAQVQAISCLAGVKESVDVIQKILKHSIEVSHQWEIMSVCKESLWVTYKFFYPEKLRDLLSLDVSERADPNTKPDWERSQDIEYTLFYKEETED